MSRAFKLLLCIATMLAACGLAHARQDGTPEEKRHRVMMILFRGMTDAERGFMNYFTERKIPVEFIVRDAGGDIGRLGEFMEEIRKTRPDLIYTFGTTVTTLVAGNADDRSVAKNTVRDIPIVFSIVADPVGAKLTRKLASSGRNLTGVSHLVPLQSQLKAMTAITKVSRLGVVYNPQEQNSKLAVDDLEKLAAEFGFHLEAVPVASRESAKPDAQALKNAMTALLVKKPDVLYLPSDSFMIANADLVVGIAIKANVPVFSATEDPIRKAGALAGLVSTYYNVGRFAAYKAESILVQHRSPADIPIETLNRFTFLVNMKTVKTLEVYPPIQVMQTAEVIR